MEINVKVVRQADLPDWAFPGGVNPVAPQPGRAQLGASNGPPPSPGASSVVTAMTVTDVKDQVSQPVSGWASACVWQLDAV
jgi:hypothetical protein